MNRISLFVTLSFSRLVAGLVFSALIILVPTSRAAGDDDFDSYKLRVDAFWFYSNPSGSIQGAGQGGLIDLQKDLHFNTYSTFAGKLDWKFTRKNHFYVVASPFSRSKQVVLNRTITFQGQTFDAGLTVQGQLDGNLYAPGYQYDIIRRKRGHLGIAAQIDLFDTNGKISAAAQVTGSGTASAARSASGSLLAPIPVAGPEFRLYLTNSPRLFVDGNVFGMYLGGYGNFVSSAGTIGLTLTKHFSIKGGYQLGSRLVVHNNSADRIGVRLTQRGALAGLEFSF